MLSELDYPLVSLEEIRNLVGYGARELIRRTAVTKNIEKSAEFAINASALAVSKPGTATVTIDEINNYINANE